MAEATTLSKVPYMDVRQLNRLVGCHCLPCDHPNMRTAILSDTEWDAYIRNGTLWVCPH